MKLGLFIGRLNPPHLGHLKIIDKSLQENDKTLLLLGSPIFQDESNPLDFKNREDLLNAKYKNLDNFFIKELLDNESDEYWIKNIIGIIDENIGEIKTLNIYGGDFKNDSVYKTIKEYEKYFSEYIINFIEVYRGNIFISHNGENHNISATKVRELCKNGDIEFLSKICDKNMSDKIAKKLAKL